jgi:molybdopterin synthase catalytic subunit
MNELEQSVHVVVSDAPIDPARLLALVSRPDSGATVLFLGTVRDHSSGKSGVTHLDYEVYSELVESKIVEVVAEASNRWPVLAVAVEHRSSRVELGEISVAVAVATAHRADAFDAGEYVIDQLKAKAPIWKKEFWPGGSEWSQGS